ncbi:hypothetical protein LDK53_22860, partial [Enterobacter sp. K16B]|uniref:hypothetical protein n=1 Tax=Enterobacter sp. K16B TaxID=2878537 RepID=UPI001CD98E6F
VGFPSGQREQTVNLPSQTSKVRILPPPPLSGSVNAAGAGLKAESARTEKERNLFFCYRKNWVAEFQDAGIV